MMGGKDKPCEQQSKLDNPAFREKKWKGRPCPRVELFPENYPASELFATVMGTTAPLIGPFFADLTAHMRRDQRLSLVRRLRRATAKWAELQEDKLKRERDAAKAKKHGKR